MEMMEYTYYAEGHLIALENKSAKKYLELISNGTTMKQKAYATLASKKSTGEFTVEGSKNTQF